MGMEKFIETSTLSGLLAAITVTSGLHLVSRLFEFLWRMREKKDLAVSESIEKLSEAVKQSTIATEKLDVRLRNVDAALLSAAKVRVDVRRLYAVVKILSGDRWDSIKKRVADDGEEAA